MKPIQRRRHQLDLHLEADSMGELRFALEQIALDLLIEGREERDVNSGGVSSGYWYTLKTDPEMTAEIYQEYLEAKPWRTTESPNPGN